MLSYITWFWGWLKDAGNTGSVEVSGSIPLSSTKYLSKNSTLQATFGWPFSFVSPKKPVGDPGATARKKRLLQS
jgi:hypothetical protein